MNEGSFLVEDMGKECFWLIQFDEGSGEFHPPPKLTTLRARGARVGMVCDLMEE